MTTLKLGSKGEAVKTLQEFLKLTIDGDFGPKTEKAVRDYQSRTGLTVDGVVGPRTWAHMGILNTDNAENDRAKQRLEDDPNHAEGCLTVAKPDVALHQLDEEVAVVPHLKKIRCVKAIGWFNRHQWLLTQHKWLSRWDEIPFVTIPRTPDRDVS